jgi:uncharacterized cupredoxin-like copper-binding protein
MHTFALKLGLVLAAEKSKTPFYIAGGLLVAWALFVSLGLGRKPDFPSSLAQQRGIMAVSAVLVILAVSMAVVVSGGSDSGTATASNTTTTTTEKTHSPTATAPSSTSSTPVATTGTPAPPSSPAASNTLALEANPQGGLNYNTTKLTAKAGVVTIDLMNSSPIEHDVALSKGSKALGQTPIFSGGSKKLTLMLSPGTYSFFCTVPGHRQAGMEGVLTVTS